MERLNRIIGYIKPRGNESINDEQKEVLPTEKDVESLDIDGFLKLQKEKSIKIVDWVNSHKKFKWGMMCDEVGVDKANFHRILKSDNPSIRAEYLSKIEGVLKQYGYK